MEASDVKRLKDLEEENLLLRNTIFTNLRHAMDLNITQLIVDCHDKQNGLRQIIEDYRENFGNELAFFTFIRKLEPGFLYSAEVVNLIADSLQILTSRDEVGKFRLDDILGLYRLTFINNPGNLDYFTDYVSFKINVLDQIDESLTEIDHFVNKLEACKDELRDILSKT